MAQQALHTNPPAATSGFDWLGTVRGIVVAPSATFQRLADARPWRQGLVFFMAVSVFRVLLHLLRPTGVAPAADDAQQTRLAAVIASPYFQAFTDVVFAPLMFLAVTGIVYQIGLRQGGDGPFARLFTTEVFSVAIVTLASVPIDMLALLFPRDDVDTFSLLLNVIGLAVAIWALVLAVLSVRASMRLSTGSSIIVLIASIVIVVLFSSLVFFILGGIVGSVLG